MRPKKIDYARSPTLETVLMVEKHIKNHDNGTARQVWKSLPRKVMWQTFLVVLDYLHETNKIATDAKGNIVYIWNPEGVKRILAKGVKLR